MKHSKIDAEDLKLIRELRRDSRARIVYLAKKTGMPTSTVYDRISKLRRLGAIFTPLLNWSAIGCSLTVCFVTPYSEELAKRSCVNSCYRVSPDSLIVECVFASLLELEAFHREIPQARTYPVVEVLKKEGFLPEPPEVL